MEFCEVIRVRHSVRVFTSRPVEPEKERMVLESANRAPSAGNQQSYEIYAVKQRGCLSALSHAAGDQESIAHAPLALVFCANTQRASRKYGARGASLYCIQDATIACAYAQLAATSLGLASTWVGAFDDNAVRQVLGIGRDLLPIAILPVGYAGEKPQATTRRPIDNLVHNIA